MNMDYYISFFMFIYFCYMYSFYYKHLLLMIISLEFIVVSVIYNMFILMESMEMGSYMIMFLLTFSVCEGALVLSLVVMMVRLHGNDYMNSLSLLKY